MKTNFRDYQKFYRWLTLPFTREPYLVQLLQRMNRILTFAMPGIYGLVFCWLFLKKTSMGGIWPFIWIPASGFVLFSLFRHWVNVPRPYEKWEIQPLLEKKSSGHSFPSRHVFSATIISMCVRAMLDVSVSSISSCPSPWRGSLSQGCSRRFGIGTHLGRTFLAGLNEQIA